MRAAAILATTVLAAACAPHRAASPDTQRDGLRDRQSEFMASLSARDADRIAALFSDSAVLHIANMPPVEGRDAIREFYRNIFRFLTASTAVPESIRVSASGDLAYGIGSVANEFRGPEGTSVNTGKYLLVWSRGSGDWMIEVYSVSGNEGSEP
jgi:ketosteroid isomerase-like protein